MATSYILSNPKDRKNGVIALSNAVFESIAQLSIAEIPNVKINDKNTFKKAAVCHSSDKGVSIEVNISVKYGEFVSDLSEQVQNHVYESVLNMTGIKLDNVSVNVSGFFD